MFINIPHVIKTYSLIYLIYSDILVNIFTDLHGNMEEYIYM